MGGPRINQETREWIIDLYFNEGSMSASQIQKRLDKENQKRLRQSEEVELLMLPAIRTIEAIVADAKKRRTSEIEFEDRPWSLLKMDEAGIPWEEAPMLLRINQALRLWLRPTRPLTVGEAKWCYKLKKAAPELTDQQVWSFATYYARAERTTKLAKVEVNTSYQEIELAFKPWVSEENRQRFLEWKVTRLRELCKNKEPEKGKEVNHESK
jgi:hypothetical protein